MKRKITNIGLTAIYVAGIIFYGIGIRYAILHMDNLYAKSFVIALALIFTAVMVVLIRAVNRDSYYNEFVDRISQKNGRKNVESHTFTDEKVLNPQEFFEMMDYSTRMKYDAGDVMRMMDSYKNYILNQDICKENIRIAYKLGLDYAKEKRTN